MLLDNLQEAREGQVPALGFHPALGHVNHARLEDVGGFFSGTSGDAGGKKLDDGIGHARLLDV